MLLSSGLIFSGVVARAVNTISLWSLPFWKIASCWKTFPGMCLLASCQLFEGLVHWLQWQFINVGILWHLAANQHSWQEVHNLSCTMNWPSAHTAQLLCIFDWTDHFKCYHGVTFLTLQILSHSSFALHTSLSELCRHCCALQNTTKQLRKSDTLILQTPMNGC